MSLDVDRVWRQVGLGEDHRPRGPEPRHRKTVIGRDPVAELPGSDRGAHPGGRELVFDGHGQAVQRAKDSPLGDGGVRGVRLGLGSLGIHRHHGVDRWVVGRYPSQEMLQQISGRDLTALEQPHQLNGRGRCQPFHADDDRYRTRQEILTASAVAPSARPDRRSLSRASERLSETSKTVGNTMRHAGPDRARG